MLKTKRHFIFDLDDTLTDSYSHNQQMFVDVFAPYLDIYEPEVEKYLRELHYARRGTGMRLQFKEVIDKFSLQVTVEKLDLENQKLHLENLEGVKIFEAVADFVKMLVAQNRKTYICTNRDSETLMKILKNNKLESFFTKIVSCRDEGYEKPDPFCLLEIIEENKLNKDACIYFGDSKTDAQFADNAGVDHLIVDHYLNQKKFYKMILESFM